MGLSDRPSKQGDLAMPTPTTPEENNPDGRRSTAVLVAVAACAALAVVLIGGRAI